MKKKKPKPKPERTELYRYLTGLEPGEYASLRKRVFRVFARANPHRYDKPVFAVINGMKRERL